MEAGQPMINQEDGWEVIDELPSVNTATTEQTTQAPNEQQSESNEQTLESSDQADTKVSSSRQAQETSEPSSSEQAQHTLEPSQQADETDQSLEETNAELMEEEDGVNICRVPPILLNDDPVSPAIVYNGAARAYGSITAIQQFLAEDERKNYAFAKKMIVKKNEKKLLELEVLDTDKIEALNNASIRLKIPNGEWSLEAANLHLFSENPYSKRVQTEKEGYYEAEVYGRLPSHKYLECLPRAHLHSDGSVDVEAQNNAMTIDIYVRAVVKTMVARYKSGSSWERKTPFEHWSWTSFLNPMDFNPETMLDSFLGGSQLIGLYRMVLYLAQRSIRPTGQNEPYLCRWIRASAYEIWNRMDRQYVSKAIAAPFPEGDLYLKAFSPAHKIEQEALRVQREQLVAQAQGMSGASEQPAESSDSAKQVDVEQTGATQKSSTKPTAHVTASDSQRIPGPLPPPTEHDHQMSQMQDSYLDRIIRRKETGKFNVFIFRLFVSD